MFLFLLSMVSVPARGVVFVSDQNVMVNISNKSHREIDIYGPNVYGGNGLPDPTSTFEITIYADSRGGFGWSYDPGSRTMYDSGFRFERAINAGVITRWYPIVGVTKECSRYDGPLPGQMKGCDTKPHRLTVELSAKWIEGVATRVRMLSDIHENVPSGERLTPRYLSGFIMMRVTQGAYVRDYNWTREGDLPVSSGSQWGNGYTGVSASSRTVRCMTSVVGLWSQCNPLNITYSSGKNVSLSASVVGMVRGCVTRANSVLLGNAVVAHANVSVDMPPSSSFVEHVKKDIQMEMKCDHPGKFQIPVVFQLSFK